MRSRLLLVAAAAVVAVAFTACDRQRAESRSEAPASSSPHASLSSVTGRESIVGMAALHDTVRARALRGDSLGLERVQVDDSAYRAHVWPTAETYEPEREEVWNFVLSMHRANSLKGMNRLLADIASEGAAARVDVPAFEARAVPGGTLHYAAKRDRDPDGSVRLFGSALCLGDSCRVISYNQGGAKRVAAEN